MKRKRRKELIVRKITPTYYSVGFWDRDTGDPGRDFRSCGARHTEEEAKKLRLELLVKESHKYY